MAKAISLEMGAPMDWATDVQTASGRDHLEDFIVRLKDFKFDEHF
jgi:aldehyde dehydrogenase (NAD+)